MSFTGLELVRHCINIGPISSFMADIVGVFLVTDHQQENDRYDWVQRLGDPEELIFWVAVNCRLKRTTGLGGEEERKGKEAEEVEKWGAHIAYTHTHTHKSTVNLPAAF